MGLKIGDSHVSSLSDGMQCVKLARHPEGVFVTHSKEDGVHLAFTNDEWAAFVGGVKNGEFDLD